MNRTNTVNGDLRKLLCECQVSWEELGWSGYALEDSASSSRDPMLSRRGLDFVGAG
jgi:hypothetical protein